MTHNVSQSNAFGETALMKNSMRLSQLSELYIREAFHKVSGVALRVKRSCSSVIHSFVAHVFYGGGKHGIFI